MICALCVYTNLCAYDGLQWNENKFTAYIVQRRNTSYAFVLNGQRHFSFTTTFLPFRPCWRYNVKRTYNIHFISLLFAYFFFSSSFLSLSKRLEFIIYFLIICKSFLANCNQYLIINRTKCNIFNLKFFYSV